MYTTRGLQSEKCFNPLHNWEWQEESAPVPPKGIERSFERRKKIMRVGLLLFVLPVVISLLLLPLRACGALLSNFY